jgi:hypothetical protein
MSDDSCIQSNSIVRPRQEALQCDGCVFFSLILRTKLPIALIQFQILIMSVPEKILIMPILNLIHVQLLMKRKFGGNTLQVSDGFLITC